MQPLTNINKLLGNFGIQMTPSISKRSDNDYKLEQEINNLHASTKSLHSQVILQSMMYEDLDVRALTGTFDKNIMNSSSYVHPVIAALFIHKIPRLENHFLMSNISNIIRSRLSQTNFTSIYDFQLFDELVRDPNDVVCDSSSTMNDLYSRALLQTNLWQSVFHLRNGQYFNPMFKEFLNTIDICRLNKNDTPDFIYGRHDGTVIKRLFSAFSFRPSVVASVPYLNIISTNPYQQNIKPVVSYVPMINIKLAYTQDNKIPIDLKNSLDQPQYILENGIVIRKTTSLIYSKEVLLFFIDRKSNMFNVKSSTFDSVEKMLSIGSSVGFERLNTNPITFSNDLFVRSDKYKLKSIVLAETNPNDRQNIIIGSSTIICDYSKASTVYYWYNPLYTSASRAPVVQIPENFSFENQEYTVTDLSQKKGIIFMYQLQEDKSGGIVN